MAKRRILHIAPTPFFSDRGCHIRVRGLVRALNELDTVNRLCTYPIGRDVGGVDLVRCPAVPGYRKTAAGPSIYKLILDPLLVLTSARQIRKFRPDVLHCHLHEGVLVGWLAKYLALRPSLRVGFDVQGGLTSELQSYGLLKNSLTRTLTRWIERFVLSRADVFYCSSQASLELLTDEFGIPRDKLVLAPDGADLIAKPAAAMHATSGTKPVAIYTGGLAKSKGLDMLQEILRTSAARQLPVEFRIIGYPTEQICAFIQQHGLKNCRVIGRVPFEELAAHLGAATVCLEPKSGDTSEASGKLLNYMAAGLPIVCFDTRNNRDMLADCGFFARSATAEAFVDQLALVLDDPHRARSRGKAARKRVAENFSWSASARKIGSRYGDLLAAG